MGNEIVCPICNKGEENQYSHLVRTWIIGDKTFECDGKTAIENNYPESFPRHGVRGSSIILLYNSEFCDHLWVEETHFHKGCTFRNVTELNSTQVAQFAKMNMSEMWRD